MKRRTPRPPGPAAAGVFLLGTLVLAGGMMLGPAILNPLLQPPPAEAAEGNRELCLRWAGSQGPERAFLADELGRRNALTKIHKLAEPEPSSGRSVYATADLLRLCRRH